MLLAYLQEISLPRSKYEEDVYINNHTSVWGSWWKDHQWGYKCCKQTIRNSYCTGSAGIEAAEAATELLKANLARKEAAEGQLDRNFHNSVTYFSMKTAFLLFFVLVFVMM